MKNICFTSKYGRELFIFNLCSDSREEMLQMVAECLERIRHRPPKSVPVLVMIRSAVFDTEVIEALQALARGGAPHVSRTAIVGATGMYRGIVGAIEGSSGCEFELCASEEEAVAYLFGTPQEEES